MAEAVDDQEDELDGSTQDENEPPGTRKRTSMSGGIRTKDFTLHVSGYLYSYFLKIHASLSRLMIINQIGNQ